MPAESGDAGPTHRAGPPVDQALDCPDPDHCPVAPHLPELRPTTLAAGTPFFRVYDATWGYDEFNPGYGDTRFAPVDDPVTGSRLPSMYLAGTSTAALLETVFRDVHHGADRIVYARSLRGMVLAQLRLPQDAVVGDLRDAELAHHDLTRAEVVSSPAEHYPCTRRLAREALAQPIAGGSIVGLLWQTRQRELGADDADGTEVAVLFGRGYPTVRGSWPLAGVGVSGLLEGPGRLLVDQLADDLGAWIEPE